MFVLLVWPECPERGGQDGSAAALGREDASLLGYRIRFRPPPPSLQLLFKEKIFKKLFACSFVCFIYSETEDCKEKLALALGHFYAEASMGHPNFDFAPTNPFLPQFPLNRNAKAGF